MNKKFRIGENISQQRNYRLVVVVILLVAISAIAIPIYYSKKPIIPRDISKQVSFPIFYPKLSNKVSYNEVSFKYSKSLGQVSYIINYDTRSLTIAEQGSPDSFTANPTFYTTFIDKLNGYATFQSVFGRVDLTEPSQVNSETAVMNANGTLLFAKSSGNLTQDQWKLLFDSLSYTQP